MAVVAKLKVTVSVINFAHLCLFLYFRSSEKHLNLFLVQVPRWQVSDICLACFHILSLSNVSNCVQGYTIWINSSKELNEIWSLHLFFQLRKQNVNQENVSAASCCFYFLPKIKRNVARSQSLPETLNFCLTIISYKLLPFLYWMCKNNLIRYYLFSFVNFTNCLKLYKIFVWQVRN